MGDRMKKLIEEMRETLFELRMTAQEAFDRGDIDALKAVSTLIITSEKQLLKARVSMLEQRDIKL